MRKLALLLASLLMFVLPALGQTTVTGTVVDPNGNVYANGTVSATLTGASGIQYQLSGSPAPVSSGPFPMTALGTFSFPLGDNSVISPPGSGYIFTLCAQSVGLGPAVTPVRICFNTAPITVTGPFQDITGPIGASPPAILGPAPSSGGGTSILPLNNTFSGNNIHTGNETFNLITSSTLNPGSSGFMRLATTDFIAWRNAANSADITLSKSQAASGTLPADLFVANAGLGGWYGAEFIDANGAPASVGAFRVSSTDLIAWRNKAGTGDNRFGQDTYSDATTDVSRFFDTPVLAKFFASGNNTFGGSSTGAASGAYRLATSEAICWRNAASSGDICITKNSSDAFLFNGVGLLISPMTLLGDSIVGGASGVPTRLAGPTGPNGVPEILLSTPSGGLATAQGWSLYGLLNREAANGDTVLSSDCANRIRFSGAVAASEALPTPATLGITKCNFKIVNNLSTVNSVTITPAGGFQINGSGTLVLLNGQAASISVDASGTSWDADVVETALVAGANITLTRSALGLSIAGSAGGGSNALCTVSFTPGAVGTTNTAGSTYCFSNPGTYTFAAADVITNDNVTLFCLDGSAILQRTTGTNDGFDLQGNNDQIIGCKIDGNGGTVNNLIVMTGNHDRANNNFLQNATTTSQTGLIRISAGIDNQANGNQCPALNDVCVYISETAAIHQFQANGNWCELTVGTTSNDACVGYHGLGNGGILGGLISNNTARWLSGTGNSYCWEGTGGNNGTLPYTVQRIHTTNNDCEFVGGNPQAFRQASCGACVTDNNTVIDNGITPGGAIWTIGDNFGGYFGHNVTTITSGGGCQTVYNFVDNARLEVGDNTSEGCGSNAGEFAYLFTNVTAQSGGDVNFHGNNCFLPASGSGTCYDFKSNINTTAMPNILFHGNKAVETGTANGIGAKFETANGGTMDSPLIGLNSYAGLANGLIINDSGVTNAKVGIQSYAGVTTRVTDNGTNSAIQDTSFTLSGTLSGGTKTVTFPAGGFSSSSSYNCLPPRDTTTPANALTLGTFTATTVVLTGTGTDAFTLSCSGR